MAESSRRKSKRTKKRRPNYLLYFIIAIFFAMAVLGFKMADAVFDPVVDKNSSSENKNSNLFGGKNTKEPVNILLIGTDEREDEPSRSDTLILATVFPKEKQVKLLSIPRDTRVKIPGRGYEKITHAHAYGQVDLVKETLEEFLDIPVHYYIKINFEGFRNIIDILGGVTLNVEKRMYYPEEDIDLQPGLQKLNGHDALAYVRYRSDGQGDIGRVERQQKFLAVLADHAKSISTIWKIPDLIKQVNTYVETDLSTKDILYYATKFANIDSSAIKAYMVPGYPDNSTGLSYWMPNEVQLEKIIEEMQIISEYKYRLISRYFFSPTRPRSRGVTQISTRC